MKHLYLLLVAIAAISCTENSNEIIQERFNKVIVDAYVKELCDVNDMSIYAEYSGITSFEMKKKYVDSLEIRVKYGMKIGKQNTSKQDK